MPMTKMRTNYDLEAVNVNKDIKKLAKEFCTKHGLVFSITESLLRVLVLTLIK
jgi:hypothetical protein